MKNKKPATTAVIIGAGRVGSTTAYALMLGGLLSEIVLIDRDVERAKGEVSDLNHATPFGNDTEIRVGDYHDVIDADVIILTAGAAQREGETRLDLAKKNTVSFTGIIENLNGHLPKSGIVIVASNPVDILTHACHQSLNIPKSRIIGTGTILDSARLKVELGQHFDVSPSSVHAYIVGEHGDSSVPVWSLATIAGMRLPRLCHTLGMVHNGPQMESLYKRARDAAYEIIRQKGATHFAIASGISRLVQAILRNDRSILSVSGPVNGAYGIADVCLSLPCIVGTNGIERQLHVDLSTDEQQRLVESADVITRTLAELGNG